MGKRNESGPQQAASGPLKTSPFGALEALRGTVKEAATDGANAAQSVAPASNSAAQVGAVPTWAREKLVVARSRKGRGGKTVTLVRGLVASPTILDELARDLRKALGCGAAMEDGELVIQGDQTERVKALLEARGAKRVVIGT